jgi:Protein of unknown function (DUF3072)
MAKSSGQRPDGRRVRTNRELARFRVLGARLWIMGTGKESDSYFPFRNLILVRAFSLRTIREQKEWFMAQTAKNKTRSGPRHDPGEVANPKANPDQNSNQIKDPEDWVTGHEPMTGAQASYLKTLSEQAHEPKAFDPELDKAEASKRIDQLKSETGR